MEQIKQRLFANWHLVRIFKLLIGIWMLAIGIQTSDWAVGLFSTFFLYQAITDTSCCGSQACHTAPGKDKRHADAAEEVEYEEIK